jgi:hypothetical protein
VIEAPISIEAKGVAVFVAARLDDLSDTGSVVFETDAPSRDMNPWSAEMSLPAGCSAGLRRSASARRWSAVASRLKVPGSAR